MKLLAINGRIVSKYRSLVLLCIPLILSAYTHLWNPVGFPAIWVVEGQYMHRAMHVLEGMGFHESQSVYPHLYDHPFFGQILLASVLGIIDYPDSLGLSFSFSSSTNINYDAIKMLWLVPRLLMGILAVLDTFLVYKLAETRYKNNNYVAFIASILFAVMPITWMLRKLFLESILLPLLLLSILFALYSKEKENCFQNKGIAIVQKKRKYGNNNLQLILISGIFLGLSILTKLPAFTMIPLAGYLIFTNSSNKKNRWKRLFVWSIPVVLIPSIWPAYAILVGDFNLWLQDTTRNIQRPDLISDSPVGSTLLNSFRYIFQIEPVLFTLGIAGVIFSEIKRDRFILLWTIPFLLFLFFINYVSFFHLILLLPALCIAAARMVFDLLRRVTNQKITCRLTFVIVSAVGIFGLLSTTLLITSNVTSAYFQLYSFIVQSLANQMSDEDINDNDNRVVFLGRHWTRGFLWIPIYVYNTNLDFKRINEVQDIPLPNPMDRFLIIMDTTLKRSLSTTLSELEVPQSYYLSRAIANFSSDTRAHYDTSKYPYASMNQNQDIKGVHVREFNFPNSSDS